MLYPINYSIISKAIEWYCSRGYTYVEVPHTVPIDIARSTFPIKEDNRYYMSKRNEIMIASGEQGFIHLALLGELPSGNYVTCSPCFRDEEYDNLHQPQFIKVELFSYGVDKIAVEEHINNCVPLFNLLKGIKDVVEVVPTSAGIDINMNGVEIGSYGTRKYHSIEWSYGTGLAEPRFSQARENK